METHDDNSVADGTPPPPWDRELWLRWLGGIIAGVVLLLACIDWFGPIPLGHPAWFIQTSSPSCPPSDMSYLLWPSIGVLLAAALLVFRFVLKYTWLESTVRSVAAMAFGIVVHFIALFLTRL